MRALFTRLAFAFVALVAQGSASEAQTTPDQRSVKEVAATVDADPQLAGFLRRCPADVYRRAKDDGPSVADDACGQRPGECLAACKQGSGEHCFRLALVFQRDGSEHPLPAQALFAAACARGKAAGCTNRGAGMRNRSYEGDPFTKRSKSSREQCHFRSFRTACNGDDAWGCAMLAQAYAEGEGVKRSQTLARRASDKSCQLAPNFVACESGRSFIRR